MTTRDSDASPPTLEHQPSSPSIQPPVPAVEVGGTPENPTLRPIGRSTDLSSPSTVHALPEGAAFSEDKSIDATMDSGHTLPPAKAVPPANAVVTPATIQPASKTSELLPGSTKPDAESERKWPQMPLSAKERLAYIVRTADDEIVKHTKRALWTGWALNAAIGLQVLLGALTTAVSAATSGRQTSIATAILGGIATLVASYLARARGSGEPELSTARTKDLDYWKRDYMAFENDYGHVRTCEHDDKIRVLRDRFERLMNGGKEPNVSPA